MEATPLNSPPPRTHTGYLPCKCRSDEGADIALALYLKNHNVVGVDSLSPIFVDISSVWSDVKVLRWFPSRHFGTGGFTIRLAFQRAYMENLKTAPWRLFIRLSSPPPMSCITSCVERAHSRPRSGQCQFRGQAQRVASGQTNRAAETRDWA